MSFIPTLRDAPAEAEAASHKLLVRGGYIRQLMSGHYSLLPLGLRVNNKVAGIIRDEMDSIGAQEFLLPALHPASIWRQSGRWEVMGDEMFRFKDRKGAEVGLGMTHEEIFTDLSLELSSYRDLPQIWYQIQTKFRDEPRPKSGLLRVREFDMKDSYSFNIDEAGLDKSFQAHHAAYVRIFDRLGLPAVPVEASSGAMGGSGSTEFMVKSEAGEDDVVHCPACGYAANVERATSSLPPVENGSGLDAPERFPTPGIRTIATLAEADELAAPENQIKTMVYVLDGQMTLALVRGDQMLNEQKLADQTGATEMRPASADEIQPALGALPGSLGAVGVSGPSIIADESLRGREAMVTGANEDDWHYRGVSIERDIAVDTWADIREVKPGEACPSCGQALEVFRAIESGHIFKLGTRYADALGATVLDEHGETRTLVMGSYGIGVGRAVAAIAETHHDENGLIWPVSVAPYQVVITVLNMDDGPTMAAAEKIYDELRAAKVETILDDRPARPGAKFKDAELIGIPYRITIGPRGLKSQLVELTPRASGETDEVPVVEIVDRLTEILARS